MRELINYLRQCFCKHDFELLDRAEIYDGVHELSLGSRWTYRCKKCGYFVINRNYNH